MKQVLSDAMKRVLIARERISRRNPFFASIIYNARIVETDKRDTIVTDGINVYFNPEYVAQADQYIEGDLLKCVMHAALQHIPRRKAREMEKWNQSCTYSVGPLVHQYFQQHPSLMDGDNLFKNKSAEAIYELLESQEDKKGGGSAGGKGQDEGEGTGDQPGGMVEPDPSQAEAAEAASKQWDRVVNAAMDKATKAGNMPANLKRIIEELLPVEKLDWRDIIRDMSRDAKSKTARSWARPNRRRNDPMMPGYGDDKIYELIIAFDVSGSVSDDMLKAMKTEVAAVLDQDLINCATLIAVDTEPKSIVRVHNSQDVIDWKPKGGGGTHFDSALELINSEYGHAIGLVFLTDLETGSFGRQTPFPTVWVNFAMHNKLKAPWGRTVDYE